MLKPWKLVPFLALASASLPSYAEDPSTMHTFDLPAETRAAWDKGGGMAHDELSNVLFDQANHFKLFQTSAAHTSVGLYLGRAVLNNLDVAQSFTVVDSLSLPVTFFSYAVPMGATPLNFGLSIGGAFQMKDFRIVSKLGMGRLESVDERAKGIESTEWFKEVAPDFKSLKDTAQEPSFTEISRQEPTNPLYRLDSLNFARYAKLWNTLSHPARLPLKAEWIDRLEVGEVITYGGSGYVEFGPGLGAVANLPQVLHQSANVALGASFHAFVRGEYDIVILREDQDHVKVKVLRRASRGGRVSLTAGTSTAYLFDGFVLLGHDVKLGGLSLVPFNFGDEQSTGNSVEMGFRFDLRSAAAREAYDLAVRGRFAEADEASAKGASGVERLFRSDAKEHGSSVTRSYKLVLYSQNRDTSTTSSDARVVMKDGAHHIYSTVVDNHFERKFLLGLRGRVETKATIDWSDSVLGLILEAWIDDSHTSGNDLREYSETFEKLVHQGVIFPRAPLTIPGRSDSVDPSQNKQPTPAEYGNSNFYLRMDVDRDQVERFINTPEQEKWRVLEEVFGVSSGSWQNNVSRNFLQAMNAAGAAVNLLLLPIDAHLEKLEPLIVADSIHQNWVKLASEKNPEKLTRLLGAQFADRVYGLRMLQVFTAAIDTKLVSYELSASNRAFGHVNLHQGTLSTTGKTLEEYRKESDLENPQKLGVDANLAVQSFKVSSPDPDTIVLDIGLMDRPAALYLRIDSAGFLQSTKKEIVVLNSGWLKSGDNHVVIDRRKNQYSKAILDALGSGGRYRASVAVSASDHTWGPVTAGTFEYRKQ
jgi:hypothetical protein